MPTPKETVEGPVGAVVIAQRFQGAAKRRIAPGRRTWHERRNFPFSRCFCFSRLGFCLISMVIQEDGGIMKYRDISGAGLFSKSRLWR